MKNQKHLLLRLVFIISLLFSNALIYGQNYVEGFSLSLSAAHADKEHLNHIIDRYNETRPWLTKEMSNIRTLYGYNIGLYMLVGDKHFYEQQFRFTHHARKVKAVGTDQSGELVKRELKYVENSVPIYFGTVFRVSDDIGIGGGGSLDLFFQSMKTRIGPESSVKDQDFEKINIATSILKTTVRCKFVYFANNSSGWFIEIFRSLGPLFSLYPLENELLPETQGDHIYSHLETPAITGINIGIFFKYDPGS